ncbi:MAG: bifunctional diaminohydroxyphosphoribosylaminopyrimidine deaminase/5-amino-6-(5-phosphoribosylamino)uracil reductase RibD [Alphaproteobacteria bacterium]|nr:bifunctional diaminohydroxyphosphoribosylaminopyrimidine deaminase/5-amino-6-(5-phosphoribosylamino)uracil reductase RibD [Alphaproteobacteria bacterium]
MPRDLHFLRHALRLAERGLGRTWPNPSVGCVLAKDDRILAAACTADGGRPHAETQALAMAGATARGATAYVTLEPCAHHGQTPPCARALIDAGIARVVIACTDPDPRVSGKGAAMLHAAGIAVDLRDIPEARRLNRGFFRRVRENLPHVAMKLATSLDGRITDSHGHSQWITGDAARAHGQQLRGRYDCLITGIGTVLADNPQMTVRAPHRAHPQLVRIVCDRHLRLPLTSTLVKSANRQPVWLITSAEAVEQAASAATELREADVKFLVLEDAALPPLSILQALAAEGITRALIEAGSALSTAFIAAGTVETLHWYRAPLLLGNAGKPAIDALDTALQTVLPRPLVASQRLGADRYECYEHALP